MKLVIAEKPMLARDIARAICGKPVSESEKLPIMGNGYTVVACAGHLLQLKSPEQINERWKWDKDFDINQLPIMVEDWGKVPIPGKEALVTQIEKLTKECSSVIHAGDPDDEGQLIVDEVLEYVNYTGKVERVLVNDNIEKNIIKAFERLEPNEKYLGMGKASYARQMADFSFGISESRLAGIRLRAKVSCGRVQLPTLGLVVRRDEDIARHKVRKFYELIARVDLAEFGETPFKLEPVESLLTAEKKIFDEDILIPIKEAINGTKQAVLTETSDKVSNPPLPYNLTILQAEMNKRYGYTADKVLEVTQSLRDKYKAISYNRSDCQYLPEEHHASAEDVMQIALKNIGKDYPLDFTLKSKAFNNSNVSAHHGIIPQQSEFDISRLTVEERTVYEAIVIRYAMQFLEPVKSKVSESRFKTEYGDFIYKVEKIVDEGYKKVFPDKSEKPTSDKTWIEDGEYQGEVTNAEIMGKETSPPKPYTEGTLLTDMASIAKYVSDPAIKEILKRKDDGKKGEHGGIGTTATRSEIIEKLKERGFIEERSKRIRSTEKGRVFYHVLPPEIVGADITAKWWIIQEDIANGKADVNSIQRSVAEIFNAHKDTAYIGKSLASDKTVLGKCPICGQNVLAGAKTAYCSSNKYDKQEDGTLTLVSGCGFKMWNTAFRKKLSDTVMQQLLSTGRSKSKVKGLKAKSGSTFEAYLVLDKRSGSIKPVFK